MPGQPDDTLVAETELVETENTEIVDEDESSAEDTESKSGAESESHNETVNASGMVLRDDTALLVTVTQSLIDTHLIA